MERAGHRRPGHGYRRSGRILGQCWIDFEHHPVLINGSCFTPSFAAACAALGAEHRNTKPRCPQTNGMVERFNGRVSSEVLGITIYSHQKLEQLLRGFNAAYNARRQRVLEGKTPEQVVAERLQARRKLARGEPEGWAGPDDIARARDIVEAAKDVSQPDSYRSGRGGLESGGVAEGLVPEEAADAVGQLR